VEKGGSESGIGGFKERLTTVQETTTVFRDTSETDPKKRHIRLNSK